MENVIFIPFSGEGRVYEAFAELKARTDVPESYMVEAIIVKKEGNSLVKKESYNLGSSSYANTIFGGLFGGLLGIFAGPIGWLVLGSAGALAGSIADADNLSYELSVFEKIGSILSNSEYAIMAIVYEGNKEPIDLFASKYGVNVVRSSVAEVKEEIDYANSIQNQIEADAKKALRAKKSEERKNKINEYKDKIKEAFKKIIP